MSTCDPNIIQSGTGGRVKEKEYKMGKKVVETIWLGLFFPPSLFYFFFKEDSYQ